MDTTVLNATEYHDVPLSLLNVSKTEGFIRSPEVRPEQRGLVRSLQPAG